MKIVINISKDDFERIKNTSFVEDTETMLHQSSEDRKSTMMLFRVMDAIKEGTPLPKHHGDLVDRDALLDGAYEIDSMYCIYDEVVNVDDIKSAPTIIEGSDS